MAPDGAENRGRRSGRLNPFHPPLPNSHQAAVRVYTAPPRRRYPRTSGSIFFGRQPIFQTKSFFACPPALLVVHQSYERRRCFSFHRSLRTPAFAGSDSLAHRIPLHGAARHLVRGPDWNRPPPATSTDPQRSSPRRQLRLVPDLLLPHRRSIFPLAPCSIFVA